MWRSLLSATFFFPYWHLPKLRSSLGFSASFTCTSSPAFLSILRERFLDLSLQISLRTPLLSFYAFTKCHVRLPGQFFSSALGIFSNLGLSPVKGTFTKIANQRLSCTFHPDSLLTLARPTACGSWSLSCGTHSHNEYKSELFSSVLLRAHLFLPNRPR